MLIRNTLLGIFSFLVLVSCEQRQESTNVLGTSGPKPIVATASLKKHLVKLISENGRRCVIEYKSVMDLPADDPKKVTLGMVSPCDFIQPGNKPLSFSYGGKLERDVVIVVGGPPDPKTSDRFQPNGCSTQYQVVNFLERGVRVSDRVEAGVQCPSWGRDEIDFGYGYGLENETQ